jgi:hypothetical protein
VSVRSGRLSAAEGELSTSSVERAVYFYQCILVAGDDTGV